MLQELRSSGSSLGRRLGFLGGGRTSVYVDLDRSLVGVTDTVLSSVNVDPVERPVQPLPHSIGESSVGTRAIGEDQTCSSAVPTSCTQAPPVKRMT